MLALAHTDATRALVRDAVRDGRIPADLARDLAPFCNDDHVPYQLLRQCYEATTTDDEPESSFTDLVRGSRVYFPPPPPPKPKSPELQRILTAIREQHESQEYYRMTGVRLAHSPSPLPERTHDGLATSGDERDIDPRATRRVVLTIVNVCFTAASVFTAVMWIGPTVSDNVAWRVFTALMLAMLVLAGEAWLAFRSASEEGGGDERKRLE
ncbi:endoplasmic reticulum-based factor for assembly of V-ATPase-domain-containing protein [Blastocladiella britannica]|nr:endoplasmic reticulum-based factor for assembly of V-ATPase-domain-containing protein [Blastocladiella britannica]